MVTNILHEEFETFLANAVNHKSIVHQQDFIGAFLQGKLKNNVFVNLDNRYADYSPEHSNYFGRALLLFQSLYGMTNSGKLIAEKLTECLLEAGFIKSQCQMSIYYEYGPNGTKIVVLYYADAYVYWYTSEALEK